MPTFADASLSGIWRVLADSRLRWKRGRDHLRSPDPDYQEKLARITACQREVAARPDALALLYLDEVTCYRQPSLAPAYALVGASQPRAERALQSNTTTRVIGALDASSDLLRYVGLSLPT